MRRRCPCPVLATVVCAALLARGAPVWATGGLPGQRSPGRTGDERVNAARLMERSLVSIKRLRNARGLAIDRTLDPNGTGIIGDEFTPLTTSLGEVEAKRTSTNPAFAAVMVDYFLRAGLRPGDVVAIGASGSFPALLLAALCAARVLELRPIVIYSVGASMYGANLPGFTFVDMLAQLRADGLLPYRVAAVSPGGDADAGGGVLFDGQGATLAAETRRSGLPIVAGASLAERITARLRIYDEAGGGRPIRCFVNIGGSAASFGDTEASLSLPNGLSLPPPPAPSSSTRGVVFEFAARGVPIVHLLHVKGLARDNRLPFDPVPLPPVGEGEVYKGR
jgi:poly-gamma-glutamate system protein